MREINERTLDAPWGSLRCRAMRLLLPVGLAFILLSAAVLGMDGFFKAGMLGESTIYARGYTDRAFASIAVGDSPKKVLTVLGPPLRRGSWGDLPNVWYYSEQRNVTDNFWRRWVVLDSSGARVVEKIADFWVD
jgi:hypothetical protein